MAAKEKVLRSGTWTDQAALSMRVERDPAELCVIELYGEFDLASVGIVARELRECAESDVEEIIVDLSGLDFIDSTGLGALVQAHRSDREDGNRLRFLRGSAPVQRVMELTCLDRSLPFAD